MVLQMSHTLVNIHSGVKHKLEFKVSKTGLCKVYLNGKLYDESYDTESAFLAYTSIRFWVNVRVEKEYISPQVDSYYISKIQELIAKA